MFHCVQVLPKGVPPTVSLRFLLGWAGRKAIAAATAAVHRPPLRLYLYNTHSAFLGSIHLYKVQSLQLPSAFKVHFQGSPVQHSVQKGSPFVLILQRSELESVFME